MSDSDLRFDSIIGGLKDRGLDLQCLVLWEKALPESEKIIKLISQDFDLVADYDLQWSDANYQRNISRLYERTLSFRERNNLDGKVGKPPFRLIVIKDRSPAYGWHMSGSGELAQSNGRVVRKKREIRALFERPFQVHSSTTPVEFGHQAWLLVGMKNLRLMLADETTRLTGVVTDLSNADGWKDFDELFTALNATCSYLVLRSPQAFETDELLSGDIDILTDNAAKLCSVLNLFGNPRQPCKGIVRVAGHNIQFDIRCIGDGYIPDLWASRMLQNRQFNGQFYQPCIEDDFFSLLYHAVVHQGALMSNYTSRLQSIGKELGADLVAPEGGWSMGAAIRLLHGYMNEKNYLYREPVDRHVGAFNINALPSRCIKPQGSAVERRFRKLGHSIRKRLYGKPG